jgi:hypothetical protein
MVKNICPITNDPIARKEAERITSAVRPNLPAGLGQPALRALAAAGLTSLDKFNGFSKADLLAMHGIGPKAVRILETALTDVDCHLTH